MGIVDLILNLAGLLLWLNWSSLSVMEPATGHPITLLGTLRRAEPLRARRWYFLVALLLLLVGRTFLYWQVGGSFQWTPGLMLGGSAIAFRSDLLSRSVAYSLFSFGGALATFYLWLLLLDALNLRPPSPDPFGRLVKLLLGFVGCWNAWLKLILPLVVVEALWFPLSLYLERLGVLPPAPWSSRAEKGLLVGLGLCLSWRYLLAAILVIHLLNSYIYLGEHPVWAYVNNLAQTLLRPFRGLPLRTKRVDFSPVVALAVILLTAEGLELVLIRTSLRI